MKNLLKSLAISIIIIAALSVSSLADNHEMEQPQDQSTELKEQTVCPVMGGKINKEVYTDIQGQRVYHCCPGCIEPMKSDPDKYFKKAAADGVRFENIQTVCPVSGENINEEVSIYHEGRTVYFCCNNCIAEFEKDPQKYLSMMDTPAKADADADADEKTHRDEQNNHEGHGN